MIYEFQVTPGKNSAFEQAWAEFTEAIHRVAGSLGSRLHKTENIQVYVAYAQWPSKESFENAASLTSYSTAETQARDRMKESVKSTKIIYRLDVVDDHLKVRQ